MRFIWDEAKRKINLAKHGLDFAGAYRVFEQPIALKRDARFHYDEERMIAIGLLDTTVVVVVHVESDGTTRIISMRRATKHEANIYYEEVSAG